MKYWKIIVVVAVVVILVIITITTLLLRPVATTTETPIQNPFANAVTSETNPSTFVKNCFQAYIPAYIAELSVTSPTQFSNYAAACFTPDFIAQWPNIVSSTDSDPVLLSQDYYNSWKTDISAITASQSQTTSSVILNLGAGSELVQLEVNLQLTPSGWRISSVTKPQ
jgi:hypothetical protein